MQRTLMSIVMTTLFLLMVSASEAEASHICPTGPGPNERQVGMTPSGTGVAPTPVCDWVENRPASSGPTARPAAALGRWAAIAMAPDGGYWLASGYRASREVEKETLRGCERAARQRGANGGCVLNVTFDDGWAVLAYGADERRKAHIGRGNDLAEATRDALRQCNAVSTGCEARDYMAHDGSAEGDLEHGSHGLDAGIDWAALAEAPDGRITSTGNYSSKSQASAAVMAECQEEARERNVVGPCVLRETFVDGFAAIAYPGADEGSMDRRHAYIGVGATAQLAGAAAVRACEAITPKCVPYENVRADGQESYGF